MSNSVNNMVRLNILHNRMEKNHSLQIFIRVVAASVVLFLFFCSYIHISDADFAWGVSLCALISIVILDVYCVKKYCNDMRELQKVKIKEIAMTKRTDRAGIVQGDEAKNFVGMRKANNYFLLSIYYALLFVFFLSIKFFLID